MIITIFIILMCVTILFFFVGKYLNLEVLQIAASGFLFLLGLIIMFGSITYASGETEFYVYGDNFSGYHWDYDYAPSPNPNALEDAYIFHTVRNTTYSSWSDEIVGGINLNHVFGLFMCIISILVFMNIYFNLGLEKDD